MWDFIATKHRNARAFAAAFWMTAAVVAGLVFKCQEARDPFLGEEKVTAVVRSVTEQIGEPLMDDLPERRGFVGVVMLPDSSEVEILLPKPPPKVGEKIPVRFERYESGDRNHAFDARAWRMYGSPP